MSDDFTRYHRQMLLPGFGPQSQQRLADATALVLGCGALGSVTADMLARAGVGHLVIVDRDIPELTNLQRQVLFDESDVRDRVPKAEAARRRIARTNSQVRVTAVVDDVNHGNIEQLAEGADILVDGLDNFETRYLANDYAVRTATPYVYGAAVGGTGMAFPVLPRGIGETAWESHDAGNFATPCFRCLFDEAPAPGTTATCDTVGVLGSVVGIVANYQVAEALKILAGQYALVNRTLLNFDLLANQFMQLKVAHQPDECPCCDKHEFPYLEGRAGSTATALCGRDAVQLRHRQHDAASDLDAIAERLRQHGHVRANDYVLQADVADGDAHYEITLFRDGRALIKGTGDPTVARSVYARYVGS